MSPLNLQFHLASSFASQAQLAAQALHRIYSQVFAGIPAFPVLLLHKGKEEFHPEKCLVAQQGEEIIGGALLTKVGQLSPVLPQISKKFGEEAADQMARVEGLLNPALPIFEIGSIVVECPSRNHGIGRKFYEFARRHSGGNVYAIINVENIQSQKAALAAGYRCVEHSRHGVRFAFDGHHAKPDPQGSHLAMAEVFCPA